MLDIAIAVAVGLVTSRFKLPQRGPKGTCWENTPHVWGKWAGYPFAITNTYPNSYPYYSGGTRTEHVQVIKQLRTCELCGFQEEHIPQPEVKPKDTGGHSSF